jgi:hypothetical protein
MEVAVNPITDVPVVPPHVDHVLDEVGRQLQITPTQFERAASAYTSVGEWLRKEGSSLAPYDPEVYPQGSMALRTTVRPLHGDEFDVDLVCQMDSWTGGPMDLHKALGARLAEHPTYAKMLEPKKRCWTLNYADDLHLDALPGRDDRDRPHDNSIEVPDRKTPKEWKPSNPTDYIAWFEEQARPYYRAIEAKQQEPLPAPQPGDASDPLRRAVQLMKRHRDVRFEGVPDNAPRSIVLTTLAAKYYNGQESVGEALLWILNGIIGEIQAADGKPFLVPNPVNPDENFAEAWREKPKTYDEFVDYIERFALDLRDLIKTPLGEDFRERSGRLFGIDVAKKAIEVFNEKHGAPALAALESIGRGPEKAPAKPWAHG